MCRNQITAAGLCLVESGSRVKRVGLLILRTFATQLLLMDLVLDAASVPSYCLRVYKWSLSGVPYLLSRFLKYGPLGFQPCNYPKILAAASFLT